MSLNKLGNIEEESLLFFLNWTELDWTESLPSHGHKAGMQAARHNSAKVTPLRQTTSFGI